MYLYGIIRLLCCRYNMTIKLQKYKGNEIYPLTVALLSDYNLKNNMCFFSCSTVPKDQNIVLRTNVLFLVCLRIFVP